LGREGIANTAAEEIGPVITQDRQEEEGQQLANILLLPHQDGEKQEKSYQIRADDGREQIDDQIRIRCGSAPPLPLIRDRNKKDYFVKKEDRSQGERKKCNNDEGPYPIDLSQAPSQVQADANGN